MRLAMARLRYGRYASPCFRRKTAKHVGVRLEERTLTLKVPRVSTEGLPMVGRFARAAALLAMAALSGCAATTMEGELIADPYESLNRDIHNFNTGVDQVLLRPTAYIYREATPALFQHLVGNAVDMLRMPVIAVNHLLQGDVESTLTAVGRFGVNIVLGAGVLDPATEFGLPLEPTDAGLTLASYGAGEGPYFVAPLLGPYTGRDAIGRIIDFAIDPTNFVRFPGGAPAAAARIATPIIDARAENFELIDDALYESEDSYVTVRTGYVLSRRRAAQAARGEEQPASLPDIFGDDTQ
jgi:phospholipid-binding lipoprotein MlaA